jgi:acyl-coenzyme A thioesterase PaaI-like protein
MTDAQPRSDADLLTGDLHADARGHFVSTLGFEFDPEADDRHARGSLTVDPYLQAEGLPWPNLATLLTMADIMIGRLASHHTAPRISVTADLGVRLFNPPAGERIEFRARLVKVGRTMTVGEADLVAERSGQVIGTALGTFLASPRPMDQAPMGFPPEFGARGDVARARTLREQVGLTLPAPGIAEIASLRSDLTNATQSLQGGVTALLGEAATYSAVAAAIGDRQVVDSLEVHYLAAARVGPFRATAQILNHGAPRSYVRAEVRDLGQDRLAAIIEATTRPLDP